MLPRCPTSLLSSARICTNDAVEACVMTRTFRDGRKRMRINAELAAPTHDAMDARHRAVQMAARVVETAAGPAGEGVEIEVLAASTALALKTRPRRLVPHHHNAIPVDENVRCGSGEGGGFCARGEVPNC